MRKVLVDFVKQYSLPLAFWLTLAITLLVVFVNTYRTAESSGCNPTFSIVTSLQKGTVSECSNTSTFDTFLSNILLPLCLIGLGFVVYLLIRGARAQIIHRRQWSWFRLFIYIFYGATLALCLTDSSLHDRKALLLTVSFMAILHLVLFLFYRTRSSIMQMRPLVPRMTCLTSARQQAILDLA
jgi:hypothetical protein